MREPDKVILFERNELDPVLATMNELARSSRGWINFHPEVRAEDLPPPRSMIGRVFSARGPLVPVGTWVPGNGSQPASLGVQHGLGGRAESRIIACGIRGPSSWRLLQDNPRRGLVVELPADEALDTVLGWLLAVMACVTDRQLTGEWRALVYRTA
ncbi:MAG: hypothetical protein N2037_09660 [Acidimicrobiales bacterium]|nr:hypothetical protein [Acidimicrobiales bacterium]